MDKNTYALITEYMLSCMGDSAHDTEHIYRVLYAALDIAGAEEAVTGNGAIDRDVLVCACLLHDISRGDQFADPSVCHAETGAKKAADFLINNGFNSEFAEKVGVCIYSHRFRSSVDMDKSRIEAKILYDADKLDAAGTFGVARSLFYNAIMGEPLYLTDANGNVSDGTNDKTPSFFKEYKYKLENIYTGFHTERGRELALNRQTSAAAFYGDTYREAMALYNNGRVLLNDFLYGNKNK